MANFNFSFTDDDGSTREETSRDGFVSGSYSYITPEGEQVRHLWAECRLTNYAVQVWKENIISYRFSYI